MLVSTARRSVGQGVSDDLPATMPSGGTNVGGYQRARWRLVHRHVDLNSATPTAIAGSCQALTLRLTDGRRAIRLRLT